MARMKGGKKFKIPKQTFNFGYVVILAFTIILVFLIGRAVGKREAYAPIIINEYTDSEPSPFKDENVRQRLLKLNQI